MDITFDKEITFDQLPQAVAHIYKKLDQIERLLLENNSTPQPDSIIWMDLEALVAYDPEKRAKTTFYAYVKRRQIPFHKRGKKIIFLRSEIDNWLKQGRQKTFPEIVEKADEYLANKKG